MAYTQSFCRFSRCYFLFPASVTDLFEVFRHSDTFPSELFSFCSGCRDAFGLPLPDEFPFGLRHIGKDLQDEIGDKGSGQVVVFDSGIQQLHIEDDDVSADFLCYVLPLHENVVVVSPQPVDTFDDEHIVPAQFCEQLFVSRAVKIFTGLIVAVNVFQRNVILLQCQKLPVNILFLC